MEGESAITCSRKSTSTCRVLIASGVKIKQEEEEDTSLQYQRNLDKVFDESAERYKKLPKGRQKLLNAKFDEHLEDLVRFHNEYGHWRVSYHSKYHDKGGLCYWLRNINRSYEKAYNEGQCHMNYIFTRQRYEKLVAIGYPLEKIPRDMTPPSISTTTTRDQIPSLVSPSSITSTINSDMKIQEDENDTWSFTEEYERNLEKVLDEYTEQFEELSEKRQKVFDEKFIEMLQNLVCFHREFRHWKVPYKETTLYPWLNRVRKIYRCAYYDGKLLPASAFPRHRYEKLVAIGYPLHEIIQSIPSLSMYQEESTPTIQLPNHSSSTSEGNATKVSTTKVRKKVLTTPTIPKDAIATVNLGREYKKTNISREENNSLKAKILQLEKENETHYETIYRLKDEKEFQSNR